MDLLILGASARSAAFSALRAGFSPSCVDLFADRDLSDACPADRVEPDDYPEGLAHFANRIEPTHWLYTGGIENHPDLVDRISERHDLMGNSGSVLRGVRNPKRLAACYQTAGIGAPEVRLDPTGLPTDGSWLIKPVASAGGRGIQPWVGEGFRPERPVYFQKQVKGISLAALFVGEPSGSLCLGITCQIVGKPGNRFTYSGTLAPWPVSGEVFDQVERIGRTIAWEFGLQGIFGVDLILKDQTPWPIEVNPRYTASVEALEWATGQSFLADHAKAFGIERRVSPIALSPEGFVGKRVLYADHSFVWSEIAVPPFEIDRMPEIADVPASGTTFRPGDPVLTVLAGGESLEDCRRLLGSRIRDWRHRLRSV